MNNLPIEKRYRPSNGSEGDIFMSKFCGKCKLESECEIYKDAMIFDKKDNEYPKEWTYNNEENPICIKFEKQ